MNGSLLAQVQKVGRSRTVRNDDFSAAICQCLDHHFRLRGTPAETGGDHRNVATARNSMERPVLRKSGQRFVDRATTGEMQEFLGPNDTAFREGVDLMQDGLSEWAHDVRHDKRLST